MLITHFICTLFMDIFKFSLHDVVISQNLKNILANCTLANDFTFPVNGWKQKWKKDHSVLNMRFGTFLLVFTVPLIECTLHTKSNTLLYCLQLFCGLSWWTLFHRNTSSKIASHIQIWFHCWNGKRTDLIHKMCIIGYEFEKIENRLKKPPLYFVYYTIHSAVQLQIDSYIDWRTAKI